jgi:sodium transport system ATP-binding protein
VTWEGCRGICSGVWIMVEVDSLSKWFPVRKRKGRGRGQKDPREEGRKFYAVRDVSFRAENGKILGLLGPNGAGKTTLLRVLSTSLKPTAGTARYDGVDVVENPLEVRRRIGFLSDDTGLYGRLTAREMIAYFGRLHGMGRTELAERMNELFVLLEMTDFADKRNDSLSAGMKQKVSIARTLVHDPDVIIFDEPTTGLDVAAAEAILRFIESRRAEGKTVLFCTHHMHEVDRLCDCVAVLDRGGLCFSGSVEEMRAKTGEVRLDKAFLALVGSGEVSDAA